jgi:eukaryotic-like serine/threonine-protein kinase
MSNDETKNLKPDSLLGHYRIVQKLGAGGMGEVFLAEDARLERKAALKILPEEFARDHERMRRFVQEAKAASALNHPNIITIYEIGEAEKTHFIAAEHIAGETLRDHCRGGGPSLASALEIAIQLASALEAAHAAGIVHRDIKPENIMIRPDGLVKILDFGIAKLTDNPGFGIANPGSQNQEAETLMQSSENNPQSQPPNPQSTLPGMIIGTAAYMSPEQARGRQIDFRSDIFSFGVLLYEVITGKQPFTGESAMDIIGAILHKEVPPLHLLVPEIPSEIERIVNKTLKKDRDERYQTTRDLLIDLKDFRQELDFQNRLRVSSASGNFSAPENAPAGLPPEAATQILKASGTAENVSPENRTAQTAAGVRSVTQSVKKHKLAALAVLVVAVLALTAGGYFAFFRAAAPHSIAVLPFANVGDAGGNTDADYLSDGLSEKLIDNLSQIGQLKVIARSSSFKYRGANVDIQDAAAKLRVDTILTGRILRRGGELEISVELIDTADQARIWGDTFNRRISDLQRMPEEITQFVTQKLRLDLTAAEKLQTTKISTQNSEAYELYLNGVYARRKTGTEDVKAAIELQNRAIALDPNFANAYAELALCYNNLIRIGVFDPKIAAPPARAAVEKARTLDATLPLAYLTSGMLRENEFDWAGAESDYRRVLELNPNMSAAHSAYAGILSYQGRSDEALREIKRAQELDPLQIGLIGYEGIILYEARRYDEALAKANASIQATGGEPGPYALLQLAKIHTAKGQYPEAINGYRTALKNEDSPSIRIALGRTLVLTGRRDEAVALLEKLKTTDKYVSPAELAILYIALGDKEKAFELLEKSYADREVMLTSLKVEPGYDPVRGDPRFQDLLRRVGFAP